MKHAIFLLISFLGLFSSFAQPPNFPDSIKVKQINTFEIIGMFKKKKSLASIHKYDYNGNLIYYKTVKMNEFIYEYQYDEKNRLTKYSFKLNHELRDYLTFEYTDTTTKIVNHKYILPDQKTGIIISNKKSRNERGDIFRDTIFDNLGMITFLEHFYEYDENGQILTETTYGTSSSGEDVGFPQKTTYSYENGACIKKEVRTYIFTMDRIKGNHVFNVKKTVFQDSIIRSVENYTYQSDTGEKCDLWQFLEYNEKGDIVLFKSMDYSTKSGKPEVVIHQVFENKYNDKGLMIWQKSKYLGWFERRKNLHRVFEYEFW